MYAAAGGASLAGRKARQHGRQPAPGSPHAHSPPHPAPTGVRAYSCQHWESRLAAPPRSLSAAPAAPSDLVECAAGRAAWQEAAAVSVGAGGSGAGGAARRCSVLGDHPGARRDQKGKWHRNNRVRDASYGSSSESDGEGDGTSGEPWGVARLLYAGLGTLAVGLVVYFVGTGDKGFKTPALRLVGPSLCIAGLACCLLRIAFCIFAKPCCKRRTNYKESRRLSNCAEGEEMPLASSGRGVGPAQCSPARRLDTSSCDVSSLSSGEEDERLRRYRISSGRPPQTTSSHSTVHQNSLPSSSQLAPSAAQKPPRTSPISPITAQPSFTFSNVPSTSALPPSNARSNVASTPTSSNVPSLPGSSECPQVSCSLPVPCNVPVSCNAPVSINVPVSCTVPVSGNEPVLCNMPVSSTASSLHQTGHRRLPPRNVSFANGPEGELVLSPAQLRS